MLVNTAEFKREGLFYLKHGQYDHGIKGSPTYKNFWNREEKRCLYGYRVGGLWIPGYMYYYLNYCKIELNDDTYGEVSKNKSKVAKRIVSFPDFWDIDLVFFYCCHIARWGVQSLDPLGMKDYDRGYKEYKNLPVNLNLVDTVENLSGGKHMLWLKPRGVGASYKASAMASRNFHLIPKMSNFMFAEDKEYLIKDGLLTKFIDYKTFLDEHTEFGIRTDNKSSLTDMHFIGSYDGEDGKTRGTLSSLIGVTMKNDPEKARGKRGILALWEEFGKFPNAQIAWNIALSSFTELDVTYGLMVGFGTGGSEDNDFYAMETMSSTPQAYNLLEFNNIYDVGMENTSFSMFTPAYFNVRAKDKDGNSDNELAKSRLDALREKALKSTDPAHIERVKAEHPYTPQEAMLSTTSNIFMVDGIGNWINKVTSSKSIHELGVPKELYRSDKGTVEARLNEVHKPVIKYPHSKKDDLYGSVIEWATPYRVTKNTTNGEKKVVPDGLYIIGHDPVAEDDVTDVTSLGAAYVYMNPNNIITGDMGDRIVASWIGRPTTMDEYNRILFLLAERWNAKIGFENDRGDVLGYAKRYNCIKWLADEFDLGWDDKIATKRKSAYKYGMRIGSGALNTRILTGNRYIADWLIEKRGVDIDGKFSYNYNYVLDPALLKELRLYNGKRNADRLSALRILVYHSKEVAYSGSNLNKPRVKSRRSSSKAKFFSGNY